MHKKLFEYAKKTKKKNYKNLRQKEKFKSHKMLCANKIKILVIIIIISNVASLKKLFIIKYSKKNFAYKMNKK